MIASRVPHWSLFGSPESSSGMMEGLRRSQRDWAAAPVSDRLCMVASFRRLLVERADELAAGLANARSTEAAQVLCAEVLPLADACQFLERRAEGLLASRKLRGGRPVWLGGTAVEIEQRPFGLVLVIGAGNYPLFLPGVQTLQALVAGNAVMLKPAPGSEAAAEQLTEILVEAGLDPGLLLLLDSAPEVAEKLMAEGVDKVLFTGSSQTGRQILHQLAESLTPATLELSGCDAVFVLPGADLDLVAKALQFGLTFNSGATCIAPRRIFIPKSRAAELEGHIRARMSHQTLPRVWEAAARRAQVAVVRALRDGARLVVGPMTSGGPMKPVVLADVTPDMEIVQSDILAPVASLIVIDDLEQALAFDDLCPYALGASVFGPGAEADRVARRINAGVVVINDMIVPTADARIPFGGRGESGFGVTRGAEGLLELTRPTVRIARGGKRRVHFQPLAPGDAALFLGYLKARHGNGWWQRVRGGLELIRAAKKKSRSTNNK